MLDFLCHVKRFNETATEDLKRQVLDRLASVSDKSGDEVELDISSDTIIVSKPLE